jgi:hypothetical protein
MKYVKEPIRDMEPVDGLLLLAQPGPNRACPPWNCGCIMQAVCVGYMDT